MSVPKISIITIVKNGEKSIERTIQSVLSQNYANLEYIIIDGLSTDRTINIIKKYNVNYITEKDLGISDAFNKGLKLCTGEIIGIINADDYYEPGIFSKIADIHNENPGSVICGSLKMYNLNRPIKILKSTPNDISKTMAICHPTVFVPNCIYQKFGNFDLNFKFSMDFDLLLRFYKNNVDFINISEVVANMQAGGTSNRNYKLARFEMLAIKKKNGVKFNRITESLNIRIHLLKKLVIKMVFKIGMGDLLFNILSKSEK